LHDQASHAYTSLLVLFDKVSLNIKTELSLFDFMVVPILLYGSEVWGVYNYKDVDRIHIRFLKSLLGVKNKLRIPLYMANSVDFLYQLFVNSDLWSSG